MHGGHCEVSLTLNTAVRIPGRIPHSAKTARITALTMTPVRRFRARQVSCSGMGLPFPKAR